MTMVNQGIEPRATEYLSRKAAFLGIPLSGTFELTPVCNMACKMCYVRMTAQEQQAIAPLATTEQWLDLAKTAQSQGMLYLLLTGGEPFLRSDLFDLLKELQNMGLLVSINTNGTLINEKMVEKLCQYPPVRLNVTLYGASDDTYARLCGNPKGFTQVDRAVNLLKEAGLTVKLNCSLTPHNAGDLDAMFAYAREKELVLQTCGYMFPPLRRDPSMVGMNERFTPEEAAYYSARIACHAQGAERFLTQVENAPMPSDPEDCGTYEGTGDSMTCRAGRCGFWVTWDGRLMPCGMFPGENAPNVFTGDFAAAWEQVKREAAAIRLPTQCAACHEKNRCKTCAAMVLTETGGFSQAPKYRCAMTKFYPYACHQVAEEWKEKNAHEEK